MSHAVQEIPDTHAARLMVLVFTDIVRSTDLRARLGDTAAARLITQHDAITQRLVSAIPRAELLKDLGDGYLLRFATPSDAVTFALQFQYAMTQADWGENPLRIRIGLHLGEVTELERETSGLPKLSGFAVDMTARVMSLANPGQILMTRAAFDSARQNIRQHPGVSPEIIGKPATTDAAELPAIRWLAHGPYLFQGNDEPLEIFEVGGVNVAPLKAPTDSIKARRAVRPGEEMTLGWRPAPGLDLPGHPNWLIKEQLGEGGFGEVWLAQNKRTGASRVFKFCFDMERLNGLKREVVLFRLMKEALGERRDIARIVDFQFDDSPYFIEIEYTPAGNLVDWANKQGGIAKVPMETRIRIVAGIATALAAAHGVGVLHKDIKPANILIEQDGDGGVYPRLTDFGIGIVTDRDQLQRSNITLGGFTESLVSGSDTAITGTRIYSPPETLVGKPFTVQGDIYALGVLLYQLVVADMDRPLGQGWERNVKDDLLREDIAACVEGDPERRLSSAAELAQRLLKLEDRRKEQARLINARATSLRRRRLLRLVMALSALLAVLLSFAVIAMFREHRLRQQATDAMRLADTQRLEAEHQRQLAITSAGEARVAQQLADDQRRQSDLRLADSDIGRGDVLGLTGRYDEATACYTDALAILEQCKVDAEPGQLALWDARRTFSPAPVNEFEGHTGLVHQAAFSRDGRIAVTASEDSTLIVWDMLTGRQRFTLHGHKGAVNAVALSADGMVALSGGADGTVRLWSLQTGEQTRLLGTRPQAVRCVALTPDGTRAAAGNLDKSVEVWDAAKGAHLNSLTGHADTVTHVLFVSNNELVSTSSDGLLKRWTLENAKEQRSLGGGPFLAISGDGRIAVSSSDDPSFIQLWDVSADKQPLRKIEGEDLGDGYAALSSDGRLMAYVAKTPTTVKLVETATGKQLWARTSPGEVATVTFTPDDRFLLIGRVHEPVLELWSVADGPDVRAFDPSPGPVTRLALTGDGRLVVSTEKPATKTGSATPADLLSIWDAATGKLLRTLTRDGLDVGALALSPDGRLAATTGYDGVLRLWNLAEGREAWATVLATPDAKDRPVVSIAFTPEGRQIFAGGRAGWIKILDAADGKEQGTLTGHSAGVYGLAFSPDGTAAASASADDTVRLWTRQGDAWTAGRALKAMAGGASSVTFSPDASVLLVNGQSQALRLLPLREGEDATPLEFSGRDTAVTSAAFAGDGRSVLIAGQENDLALWNTQTGRQLHSFTADLSRGSVVRTPAGFVTALAQGSKMTLMDFARQAQYQAFQPRLLKARATLLSDPTNPGALETLGEWYAFLGIDDWALMLLAAARSAGASVPPLTLARSDWMLGRIPEAREEFRKALEQKDAPEFYLKLCLEALGAGAH